MIIYHHADIISPMDENITNLYNIISHTAENITRLYNIISSTYEISKCMSC